MPKSTDIEDPVERVIADALDEADIPFYHEVPTGDRAIDFYLPLEDVYIECKRFHSDRTDAQMSVCENIIVVQGMESARLLAKLIRASTNPTFEEVKRQIFNQHD